MRGGRGAEEGQDEEGRLSSARAEYARLASSRAFRSEAVFVIYCGWASEVPEGSTGFSLLELPAQARVCACNSCALATAHGGARNADAGASGVPVQGQ